MWIINAINQALASGNILLVVAGKPVRAVEVSFTLPFCGSPGLTVTYLHDTCETVVNYFVS